MSDFQQILNSVQALSGRFDSVDDRLSKIEAHIVEIKKDINDIKKFVPTENADFQLKKAK